MKSLSSLNLMMRKKSFSKNILIEVNDKAIPGKIYWEQRNNVRFSIGKTSAIMRMPILLGKREQEKQVEAFKDWVRIQLADKEVLQKRFFGKGYENGSVLKVGKRTYQIRIEFSKNKTHTGKLIEDTIYLKLSEGDADPHLQKAIKHILSRLVAQDFLPEITKRVFQLNEQFFQQPIRSVNLKYNQTNWGSCSSKNNINLSTRLLFAPEAVVDYVIIHELAHLLEMNHSPRFWKIVENVMPLYQEKERWLKEYGNNCDF